MKLTKRRFCFGLALNALGFAIGGAPLLGLAINANADTVAMHGGVSVITTVINPHRAEVEKKTGHKLAIVSNSAGAGLIDLIEGKADVALSSGPLDVTLVGAEAAGKKVDPKSLQYHEMAKDEVVFIVHPSNPVSALTIDQVRDILLGKITNWKQVGGKDQQITIYADPPTGGTRLFVKKALLGGAEYAPGIKSLISATRVSEVMASEESGIAAVGRELASKSRVLQTKKIERPLGFITLGAPSPKVKQVMDAFKAASK